MHKSVGVVIVTFNRLNLLKITLCKVFSQTYKQINVLVVNNCSTDGTTEYLQTLVNVKTINLDDNLGPAGGFYEGVKYFAEVDPTELVWLMDDDFFPAKTCLDELIKESNDSNIVFPYVRDKKMKSVAYPGWWGVLIPSAIVKVVGYPLKDLFFWAEDTEYLQARISQKFKYDSIRVSKAKGVHFTYRKTNYRQAWRYYYEIRNMIYSRLYIRERTPTRIKKLIISWNKLFLSILLKENDKKKKLKFFFLGSKHGIQKKIGKTVDPNNY
jgi:GT2 family glycosyltransferase